MHARFATAMHWKFERAIKIMNKQGAEAVRGDTRAFGVLGEYIGVME